MPPFTHLHLHTEYSLLDGLCRIDALIERARELGMDAMGLTDHGALHAVVDFYQAAKHAGVKPVIGIEAYLARGSRHDRTMGEKQPNHITLLAKNNKGYHNLIQLATKAQLEGFYYKPRIDRELLEKHHEGLIAFSGCLNGPVPQLIKEGRLDDAKATARWLKDVVGDFYLEVQHHENIPELAEVNKRLVEMGRETGIPLVATNDVHYVHQHEHHIQDILLCIQTNTTVDTPDRMRMTDLSYYLRSTEEMEALFNDLPESIASTRRIAEMCDVSMESGKLHLPQYPVPGGKTAEGYLAELCWEGLQRRYGQVTEEVRQRLAYELDVITKTRFANYFLVIWQISTFARERNILMGVRGSAAASLVLYALGVTNADPLKYRLVFERFLNIERKELPDVDMDFQDDRRDEVMDFVVKQYGEDRVAQIITFGTLGAKAALRDTGRALGMSYADVDRVARLIPAGYLKGEKGEIKPWTIKEAKATIPEFRQAYEGDPIIKNLVDTSQQLEGVARNAGTHAAGVVISDEPLVNCVPLQRAVKGNGGGIAVTQFAMEAIARLGLLKMDFLGLVNLTILQKTCQFIKASRGIVIDLLQVPLDDAKTFHLLSSGETTGMFQLESAGMRRYIKELKPTTLGDLSAMIALYRPGPMEQIQTFIDAKHGKKAVHYPHPALKDILEESYGVIVYQDQVLLILQRFAGYSLGRADIVRKAMGKKNAALMQQEKSNFIQGAMAQGYSMELAVQVWNLIEPFAGYAFNKAHSISYALIAYWTAYFKANYDMEFMAALLTCFQGATDKVQTTIAECRRLGIEVLSPDINQVGAGFAIERGASGSGRAIRFSLAAVKNVGESAVAPIIQERERGGPFKSIEDFCRRAPVRSLNKRTLESLIKVGAFGSLGQPGPLLASLDRIVSSAQQQAQMRETGQATMFDLFGASVPVPLPELELKGEEVSQKQRLDWQKELLGVYLEDHPLAQVTRDLGQDVTFCGQVSAETEGQRVTLAGQVKSVRRLLTRKDQRIFVSVLLEDLLGSVEVAVFPNVYERTAHLWEEDAILVVRGRVRVRDERVSIACESAQAYSEATAQRAAETSTRSEAPSSEPAPAIAEAPAATYPARGANGHTANGHGVTSYATPSAPAIEAPQPETMPQAVYIYLRETDDEETDMAAWRRLRAFMRQHPGPTLVRLTIVSQQESKTWDMPGITGSGDVLRELASLVGPDSLQVA